jgi:ubiquinone/menaquinone biosynthesis C-methylase UbiE
LTDKWSRWLLERRDAGDERQRELTLQWLRPIRDRVLDLAGPLAGKTLLDVGTGDGLIGREAQRRGAEVIFADISAALLEHLRGEVDGTFALTRAEDLAEIADASVDVVTTRSVLIYVDDKASAFAAMRRVLRPGGRISLFEPINALMFPEPSGRFFGYDVSPVAELAARVSASLERSEAMVGFDDRDLLRFVEQAGFSQIHIETHADVVQDAVASANALLNSAPNPNAPTLRETIERALDPGEQHRFIEELSAAVERGPGIRRTIATYVSAVS